jgi:hypothetical protein
VPLGQRLGFDGVERGEGDASVVERASERRLVDERSARDVHEVYAGLDRRERCLADDAARVVGGGRDQHQVVGGRDQVLERGRELHAGERARCRAPAELADPHAEGQGALRDGAADAPDADERQRPSGRHRQMIPRRGAQPDGSRSFEHRHLRSTHWRSGSRRAAKQVTSIPDGVGRKQCCRPRVHPRRLPSREYDSACPTAA